MDIEKERKAFESTHENIRLLRGAKFKDGKYVALSLFDDSSKERAAQLNYGWAIWLKAKAHEAEKLKGCVVVPVNPTNSMCHAGKEVDGRLSAFKCADIYKAMVEAARGGNE